MAKGINKVILVGNLGGDPEESKTGGGMAVTKIKLATSSSRKDRDGNRQEETEWHQVKFFGKLAEIAGEYLKKGNQVYVEGRIHYGKYTKDGVDKYFTEIIADDMQMLGSRADSNRRDDDNRSSRSSAPRQGQGQRAPAQQPDYSGDDFDQDDIPF